MASSLDSLLLIALPTSTETRVVQQANSKIMLSTAYFQIKLSFSNASNLMY